MITNLLLSLTASAASILSPVATATSDPLSTAEVQATCLKAAEGDPLSEIECLKSIREQADRLLVDELSPDFQSTCLVIERASQSDLIWFYLDWLEEHPGAGKKPATTTINAALLEKLPCGWREQ